MFVLKELERLNDGYTKLNDKVDNLKIQLVVMKAKAGVWGLIAGGVISIIAAIIPFLIKLITGV